MPSILPRQKILEKIGFPSSKEKAMMYENSYDLFMKAGYVAIGMDHFSKPGDEFDIALKNKQLHRNFQGYCTRETTGQVYAFGASSISQLDSAYSQNIKNAAQYINSIEKNNLAVLRGYSVNDEQKIVRDAINTIMCNYYLDLFEIAKKNNCSVEKVVNVLDFNASKFEDFISDNLIKIQDSKLIVFEKGRLFTRNIAMRFDPLINQKVGTYSNTI